MRWIIFDLPQVNNLWRRRLDYLGAMAEDADFEDIVEPEKEKGNEDD